MKKSFLFFALGTLAFFFSLNAFSQENIFGKVEESDKSETVKKANRKLKFDDVEGALKILDKAIEKKEDLAEAYQKRAYIRLFYKNDTDGALADLNSALAVNPENIDSYIYRASLKKREKNDLRGALLDYQTAQKYKPDSGLLFDLIITLKTDLKDFDGAIAEIQSALRFSPDAVDLHSSLSNLLEQKNELDKAIVHLQGFLDDYVKKSNGKLPKIKGERVKKNETPIGFNGSSNAKNSTPVKRYSQMDIFNVSSIKDLENFMKATEEARSLSRAFIQLGKLYIAKNDIDKAFINLDTALEIDRNQEEAHGLRGILHLSKGENEKAIVELSNAIEIADEPSFYLNRGTAYLANANNKKAQSDFDKFIKIYPEGQTILNQRIAETKQQLQQKTAQPK